MTQNIVQIPSAAGPVKVMIGWDRPLKEFFCNTELEDDPLESYVGLMITSSPQGGLEPFKAALSAAGLAVPDAIFEATALDQEFNKGNIIRSFSPEGLLLQEHSFGR